MLQRIGLLLVAALLVAMMAVAGAGSVFAGPDCTAPQHEDHPNCTEPALPSGNEPNGNACSNPNQPCSDPTFVPSL